MTRIWSSLQHTSFPSRSGHAYISSFVLISGSLGEKTDAYGVWVYWGSGQGVFDGTPSLTHCWVKEHLGGPLKDTADAKRVSMMSWWIIIIE